MADEIMLQEALGAIRQGEVKRARDLLTRLLKSDPNNGQYWLYMSSVVETAKERIFCLQEVLKRDPQNETARRGLVLLGALPPDDAPRAPMQRRNWQAFLTAPVEVPKLSPQKLVVRAAMIGGAALAVIALIVVSVIGAERQRAAAVPLRPANTLKPSATYLPSPSPVVRSPTPTFFGPTPLWMMLAATYTPTPLYVNTPHPRSEAYRAALAKMEQGDLNSMLDFFEQFAREEPDSADAFYYLGEGYRLTGRYADALEQYNHALQINPNFAPAFLGRALANQALDPKNDTIDDDLMLATGLDPNLNEAVLALADLHVRRGDGQAALDLLSANEPRLTSSPLFYLYRAQAELLLGQNEAALSDAQQANQLDLTLLDAYWTLGRAYQANGRLVDAIKPLETYTTYVTGNADAWVLLGLAYSSDARDDAALQAYSRALDLDKRLFEAYLQRGLIYLKLNDGKNALDNLDTALKLNSKSFDASLGIGRAYLLLNYAANARTQFNRAEALAESDTQQAAVHYYRAISLEALGRNDLALTDWQALMGLPAEAVPPDWMDAALQRVATLTPSPEGETGTPPSP